MTERIERKGKFFVMEGGPGSGKSTQLSLLAKELGKKWVYYREPGSTVFGEFMRTAVQSRLGGEGDPYPVHSYAALFAYSAARANLIRLKVIPALQEGRNVGLDRYWYSTYAYQGAEGVSKVLIYAVSLIATRGLQPNLVLHYDLLPQIGIERKNKDYDSDKDRYDVRKLEFHEVVRANYHQLKFLYPGIWEVIDASKSIDEVKADSLRMLKKHGLLR